MTATEIMTTIREAKAASVGPCPECEGTGMIRMETFDPASYSMRSSGTKICKSPVCRPDLYPVMDWREACMALAAEVERLTECLKKANALAERFEREWYLRGDALGLD